MPAGVFEGIVNATDLELLDPELPIEAIDRLPSSISFTSGLLSVDNPYRITKPDVTGAFPMFLIVSIIVMDCPGFAQVGPVRLGITKSGSDVGTGGSGSGPGPGSGPGSGSDLHGSTVPPQGIHPFGGG